MKLDIEFVVSGIVALLGFLVIAMGLLAFHDAPIVTDHYEELKHDFMMQTLDKNQSKKYTIANQICAERIPIINDQMIIPGLDWTVKECIMELTGW